MTDQPRVWVGCLACYNAGRLTGAWFDAVDADDVTGDDVHGGAPYPDHEELWCMDHDGFHGVLKGECSPGDAAAVAKVLLEVDATDRAAFGEFIAYGNDVTDGDVLSRFRDSYLGRYESMRVYAMDLAYEVEEDDTLSRWPYSCVDWGHAARELEMGDYYSVSAGAPDYGVYVFRMD